MIDSSVWSPTQEGEPGVALGLPLTETLAPGSILGVAGALLRDYAGVLLLFGACLFALNLLPTFLSVPLSVAMELWLTADLTELQRQVLSESVSILTTLAPVPFQFMLLAGGMRAIAQAVITDEPRFFPLFTSFMPAVRVFGFAVVSGLATTPLYLLVIGFSALPFAFSDDLMVAGGAAVTMGSVGLLALSVLLLPLQFGLYAAALDDLGPIEALTFSWSVAHPARPQMLLVVFLLIVSTLLSCVLCTLPVVIVQPVFYGVMTVAWLRATRPVAQQEGWAFLKRNELV